jgi:hypothetical protein
MAGKTVRSTAFRTGGGTALFRPDELCQYLTARLPGQVSGVLWGARKRCVHTGEMAA